MLEHSNFKNLSYTVFRGRGGAAEAVTLYKHFIAWLDSFCISCKIQHTAERQILWKTSISLERLGIHRGKYPEERDRKR